MTGMDCRANRCAGNFSMARSARCFVLATLLLSHAAAAETLTGVSVRLHSMDCSWLQVFVLARWLFSDPHEGTQTHLAFLIERKWHDAIKPTARSEAPANTIVD